MRYNYLAGLMVCATLLILGIFLTTNSYDLSRDNPGWNGSSEFFHKPDRYTTEMIQDIGLLKGKTDSAFLIIAPTGTYSDEEINDIRSFLHGGNTIILADETDAGNSLLSGLASSIRIGPFYLAGLDRAYNNSSIIVTNPVTDHPLTAGVESLVLDKAKPLTGGQAIIQTGIMSWIDLNSDYRMSSGESFGRYTVLAREQAGDGELIVLSDSGVFINSMSGLEPEWGNRQFITNIITYRPKLLIEQVHSRTADQNRFGWLAGMVRSDPIIKGLVVLIALLACAFFLRKRPPDLSFIDPGPVKILGSADKYQDV